MATVRLVRHGETAWNRDGRVQGWAPTELTDRGRAEARALAARIDDPDRVVASDLRRARATAERITGPTPPTTDARWRERDWGRLQGLDDGALYERYPRFSLAGGDRETAMTARPEGGESLRETRSRVLDAWADLRASLDPDATAVVVTHAVPIAVVRAASTGRAPAVAILDGGVGTGETVTLRVGTAGASVVGGD